MQLANEYLDGAALAGVGGPSLPENVGAKVQEVRAPRASCCRIRCRSLSAVTWRAWLRTAYHRDPCTTQVLMEGDLARWLLRQFACN